MILFAQSVKDEKKALDKALADFDAGYAIAHRAYVKGLLAMYGDLASFPDANSTLRLTYGQLRKVVYCPDRWLKAVVGRIAENQGKGEHT